MPTWQEIFDHAAKIAAERDELKTKVRVLEDDNYRLRGQLNVAHNQLKAIKEKKED